MRIPCPIYYRADLLNLNFSSFKIFSDLRRVFSLINKKKKKNIKTKIVTKRFLNQFNHLGW